MIDPDFAWAALIFGGTLLLIVYAFGCIAFLFRLVDAANDEPEEESRCVKPCACPGLLGDSCHLGDGCRAMNKIRARGQK